MANYDLAEAKKLLTGHAAKHGHFRDGRLAAARALLEDLASMDECKACGWTFEVDQSEPTSMTIGFTPKPPPFSPNESTRANLYLKYEANGNRWELSSFSGTLTSIHVDYNPVSGAFTESAAATIIAAVCEQLTRGITRKTR